MTLVQTFIYMLVWSNVRCFYFRPPTHDNESKQTQILEGNINQIRCQHHSVKWLNFSYSQRHEQKCIQRNMCSIIRSNIITDSTDFILVSSWLNVCTNTGRGGGLLLFECIMNCVCACVWTMMKKRECVGERETQGKDDCDSELDVRMRHLARVIQERAGVSHHAHLFQLQPQSMLGIWEA